MTDMRAFFDESGSHVGSPVLCMAGYLFPDAQIASFSDRWNEALRTRGLDHFHMIDFAHSKKGFGRLDTGAKTELIIQLIDLINAHVERGFGVMVVEETYERLMPYHPGMGSAYNYCLWHCLEGVMVWAKESGYTGDVEYCFEAGHASQPEANRILKQAFRDLDSRRPFRYASHEFADKKSSACLQAADLLAWQVFTDVKHGMSGRPRRKDFAALIAPKKHRMQFMGEQRILYHLREMEKMGAWAPDLE